MNHEVEIKEMLAVARELMREWHRMMLYRETAALAKQWDADSRWHGQCARDAVVAFDAQFPKEAP